MSTTNTKTPDTEPTPPPSYHTPLLTSLHTINTHNPPVHTCSTGWTFNALISGPTSIAYLFYRLATLYPETERFEFTFKGQGMRDWAGDYIALGGRGGCGIGVDGVSGGGGGSVMIGCDEALTWKVVRGVIEEDEGVIGEVVEIGRRRRQIVSVDGRNKEFGGRKAEGIGSADSGNDGHSNGDDVRGRGAVNGPDMDMNDLSWWAGYLYLLRVLRQAFPDPKPTTTIKNTIDQVVDHLFLLSHKELSKGTVNTSNITLMTSLMTQIVLSTHQNHTITLTNLISNILTLQDQHSGNWGAHTALLVNSFESISKFLPEALQRCVTVANQRARAFLFQDDSLKDVPPTMQPDGLVTRAMAFTDTDDGRFHDVLAGLRNDCLDEVRPGWKKGAGIKDGWVGLRTGEAGRAWCWAVAELSSGEFGDGRIDRRILGYNDV